MPASAPRIGIAVLAVAAAIALTIGIAVPFSAQHFVPAPKMHAEVRITELAGDKDMRVRPAAAGTIDTVTVRAAR
jgi:hypothetical protein